MARLYADENFSQRVVELLRAFGHDVITTFTWFYLSYGAVVWVEIGFTPLA